VKAHKTNWGQVFNTDANMSKLDWVDQPGNALANQTQYFSDGYVKGWCLIMGPNHGKETDNAVFDCERTR
jgi:hypothetical protein